MASTYEKALGAELVVVMAIQTLDALAGDTIDPDTGSVEGTTLPDPARYVATVIVFAMLAAVAMFGDKPGKLAAQFGGVAALAIIVAPGVGGKTPPIIGALGWMNQMILGGGSAQLPNPAGSSSSSGAGTTAQNVTNPGPVMSGTPVTPGGPVYSSGTTAATTNAPTEGANG